MKIKTSTSVATHSVVTNTTNKTDRFETKKEEGEKKPKTTRI